MKKIKNIDKYFEEARNQQPVYSMEKARNILENSVAGNATYSNKFWKKLKGIKTMNIITTAAASIALVGILSFGIFNSDSDKPTENDIVSNHRNEQIQDFIANYNVNDNIDEQDRKVESIADVMNSTEVEDKPKDTERSVIIRNDNVQTESIKTISDEKVSIKGINVIQLSKEELAKLGIEVIKDDNSRNNHKSPYGLAYCDNWVSKIPVRTVVMKDWGIVRNSEWEITDIDNCISPRIITDNKGNRRVEVFNDRDDLTTKTYYSVFDDVHEDNSGNEIRIKTNQTITSYHRNIDDSDNSKEQKVIVNSNNIELNENNSEMPDVSSIIIASIDSSNNYIINDGDSVIMSSVFVFDKQRMKDLDIKLKKFNFEWHEEELEELKEGLDELIEQQKLNQGKIDDSKKIYKLYGDTVLTSSFKLDSIIKKFIMNKFDFDSLKNSTLKMSDSLIQRFIDIDLKELEGMNKRKHDENNMLFIKRFNNIERDINNYIRVNKMIPIEVPIEEDGDDFSFILWFDATPELLEKLPARVSDMIEIELDVLQNTSNVCQTPIKGEEAFLDIWRSCSGAIENLHVFPNPTSGDANIQFNLTDAREFKISLHDLYGRRINEINAYERAEGGLIRKDIQLGELAPGMYLIAVESKNGEQAVQRIIVE